MRLKTNDKKRIYVLYLVLLFISLTHTHGDIADFVKILESFQVLTLRPVEHVELQEVVPIFETLPWTHLSSYDIFDAYY